MVAKQFVAIFPVYNRPNGKRDVRGSYLIYEYGHLSHHEATASIFAWFGGGGGGDHFQSLELRLLWIQSGVALLISYSHNCRI